MVRPLPGVLGGRGIEVVCDDESMAGYMAAAVGVTPDRPILIDRFPNHATECEADYQRWYTCLCTAVMEHIELAGVHSVTLLVSCLLCIFSLPENGNNH